MVPLSCCVINQYDEYIDPSKCQTHKTGPPERKSGEANEALNYRVRYTGVAKLLQGVEVGMDPRSGERIA